MDPLIIGGSLAAILILFGVNYVLGGWQSARLDSIDVARNHFAEDFWDDTVKHGILDVQGRAALLMLSEAPAVGLVWVHGDHLVTRRLTPGRLREWTIRPQAGTEDLTLTLRLHDYAAPTIILRVAANALDREWRDCLDQLTGDRPLAKLAP